MRSTLFRPFLAVLALNLTACGALPIPQDKDAGPTSSATVTMKVDGVAWSSTTGTGFYSTGSGGAANVSVVARRVGSDGGLEVVTITMANPTGPGTFEARPYTNNEVLYDAYGANDRVREDGGITVTSFDAAARNAEGLIPFTGTFQGRGRKACCSGSSTSDVVISEGTFDARLAPTN